MAGVFGKGGYGTQTVENVLRAGYPELMEDKTFEDILEALGQAGVKKLLKQAARSRLEGSLPEDLLSFGLASFPNLVTKALGAGMNIDDITAAQQYGNKADQAWELAQMIPTMGGNPKKLYEMFGGALSLDMIRRISILQKMTNKGVNKLQHPMLRVMRILGLKIC